jgi:hypothetical protein
MAWYGVSSITGSARPDYYRFYSEDLTEAQSEAVALATENTGQMFYVHEITSCPIFKASTNTTVSTEVM